MQRTVWAAAGAAALIMGAAVYADTHAQSNSGVNVGSLTCNVSGGVGFIFGSSKSMDCIFARGDGTADHYYGTVKKFGVDIGFTKEAHVVWLVFAPGQVAKGALAGEYVGGTGSATVGVGVGANALVGGSNRSITLQPVSIEGSTGLNVAGGIADIQLSSNP
jgi:hypothetical protein